MTAGRPVLVTGGAGYVGSHAARALARDGRAVVVLDDFSSGHRGAVRWGTLVEGSAADQALVRATCRRHEIGAVLHFAGRIRVEESVADPAGYRSANVEMTARLAEAVLAEGVRSFVFSSSAAVYGTPSRVPIPEDHPHRPTSPYGATKVEAEAVLAASGLRVASLRYFNAAGAAWRDLIGEAHEPETHLIPLALDAAAEGRPFTVFGDDWDTPDGTCVRDYVHVEDLADAHVAALERLESGGASDSWNLGTGRGHSVREVIDVVVRVTGCKLDVRVGPRRAGDPKALVADASKAMRDFGWEPKASSIERIVSDAWEFRRLGRAHVESRTGPASDGSPSARSSSSRSPSGGGASCAT